MTHDLMASLISELRAGAPIRVARKILAAAPEFDFIAPEGPNQVVQALGLTVVVATPSLRKELRLVDRSSAGGVQIFMLRGERSS